MTWIEDMRRRKRGQTAPCDKCGKQPAVYHPARRGWYCRDCVPGTV